MSDICWFCEKDLNWEEGQFEKVCPNCYAENDRTPYIPEPQPKEEEVIISNNLTPFFKKGDLQPGAVGMIKTIFEPSGQYQNPTGEIDFNGKVFKVSFNKTSVYDVVSAFGGDTKSWVGKEVKYNLEDIENKKTNALYRGVAVFRAVK